MEDARAMSVDYLFVPLSPDRNALATVPLSTFCEVFERFGIEMDYVRELGDGSHEFDYSTADDAPLTLSDQGGLSIKDGAIASFWIHSPDADGKPLWLALLNAGFTMLPTGGPLFVNPAVAREISYLREIDPTVRVVERVEDFIF